MSRELGIPVTRTPVLADPWVYAKLRSEDDDSVWQRTTSSLVPFVSADVGTYDIPLTARGDGWYRGDIPSALPPGVYKAFYSIRAATGATATDADTDLGYSNPFTWSGSAIGVPVPSGGWRYSDRAHVVAMLAAASVAVVWDLDDDNTEDAGAMEQDGILADGWIDGELAVNGITVPVTIASQPAYIQQMFADIGAHMTVWYGFHRRGLEEMSGRGVGSAKDIAGLMSGYLDYAKEQMAKLVTILQRIDTDDSVLPSGSLAGAITAVVGAPKQYPGTGCVRPAAIVVPNLASGVASW